MPDELQPSDLGLEDFSSLAGQRAEQDVVPDAEDEYVDAELVPPSPGPFSFGIKALLALTGIASVQFALMAYLGPMVGLMAGIGLCVSAMGVLLVASIFMGLKPGSGLMDQLDRIAIRLVVGIVVLFFGTILAGGGQMIYSVLAEAQFKWKMQSDLGVTYVQQSLYDQDLGEFVNVLVLTKVTAGSVFDQAGVQKGDLILLDGTAEEFLQKLDEQRGKSIDIPIANFLPSSGNSEIDEATERTVTIHLPK